MKCHLSWLLLIGCWGQPRPLAALPSHCGDLSLPQAVQLALRHSPDPALASWQKSIQEAERRRTASEASPKLGLGMFLARQDASMIYATGADPNFVQQLPPGTSASFNLMAMLPLYNAPLRHRLEAAEKSERLAEARQQVVLRRLSRDVCKGYLESCQAEADLQAERQGLLAREQLREQAGKLFLAGKEARFVVLRAEAEEAAARQQLHQAEATLAEKQAALKALLGLSWESQLRLVAPSDLPAAPEDLALCQELARNQRPELVAANFAMEVGDSRLLASLAEYSPRLSLVAMGEAMRPGLNRWEPGYSLGLTLSLPLWDGGQRQAQVDQARAEREVLALQLQQLQLQIEGEVSAAHARLSQALQNVGLAQIELDKAEEEQRIASLRQKLGRALYLEVLDGLALASRARVNRLKAQYQAHIQRAEYLYALGSPL